MDSEAFQSLFEAAQKAWPAEEGRQQMEEALELYRGEFLQGVFARESRGLEEWTLTIMEQLQRQAIFAHHQLADHYLHTQLIYKFLQYAPEHVFDAAVLLFHNERQ